MGSRSASSIGATDWSACGAAAALGCACRHDNDSNVNNEIIVYYPSSVNNLGGYDCIATVANDDTTIGRRRSLIIARPNDSRDRIRGQIGFTARRAVNPKRPARAVLDHVGGTEIEAFTRDDTVAVRIDQLITAEIVDRTMAPTGLSSLQTDACSGTSRLAVVSMTGICWHIALISHQEPAGRYVPGLRCQSLCDTHTTIATHGGGTQRRIDIRSTPSTHSAIG
jgi:hypothetical protein